ncbi:MAG TPA: carboxypeptidase-like regulatory domain-containing protein, partial [Gemmatimonadales bacterium]|nr:carboxypeptidase-like regulatory domain-containing protein [Gemmatimonadales bacterium]
MRILSTSVLLLALVAPAAAQSVGVITGFVREVGDTNSPRLAGARVSVDNGRYVTTSDARGVYRVREIPAGWHSVRVSAIGYRAQIRDSVLVRGGQTTALDLELKADP